jgi:hypothetical protein
MENKMSHAERIALEAAAALAGEIAPPLAVQAAPLSGWGIASAAPRPSPFARPSK